MNVSADQTSRLMQVFLHVIELASEEERTVAWLEEHQLANRQSRQLQAEAEQLLRREQPELDASAEAAEVLP